MIDLPLVAVDPDVVIEAAVGTVSAVMHNHGFVLVRNKLLESVLVLANEDRMCQVLINLLFNAVKYNDAPKPEITISASVGAQHLNIDIADSGGGIAHEEALTVFEKFNRVRRSALNEGQALGCQLAAPLCVRCKVT